MFTFPDFDNAFQIVSTRLNNFGDARGHQMFIDVNLVRKDSLNEFGFVYGKSDPYDKDQFFRLINKIVKKYQSENNYVKHVVNRYHQTELLRKIHKFKQNHEFQIRPIFYYNTYVRLQSDLLFWVKLI